MIHPTAFVDPAAKVPASCSVGPYCIVGAEVELGENCELISHVVIHGPTKIADNNVVRECVTLNRGTIKGGGVTRIGSHTLIMAYSHVGHDSVIGDHAMLVN